MLSALAVALVIAAAALAVRGAGEAGTVLGLRLTARWSYLWFWSAYTAAAWSALLGPRFPEVAARARNLGLGFAAAHLVHVALVVWLYRIAEHPPGVQTLEFFGVAVFFTYLLALLSFRRPAAWLPRRVLTVIRTVGVEYIALAFLVDFARDPGRHTLAHALGYGVFLALGVLAYALRVTALVRRRLRAITARAAAPGAANTSGHDARAEPGRGRPR
jgi:hypothetical protein